MSVTPAASQIDRFVDRIGSVATPFSFVLPDGSQRFVGQGKPKFKVTLHNKQAVRAIRSLDEANVAEAYMNGDIDIDGDMIQPFALRASMNDRHPLVVAWRFIEPLLFGQIYTNRAAISSHYEIDSALFLSFLDKKYPMYSQGVYNGDQESLSVANRRKMDYCIEKCEIGPGKSVLEIGPGWGAFAKYALDRGVAYTGITIAEESRSFLNQVLSKYADRKEIILSDLYDFKPEKKFDSIVIMGVIEHLPDYGRVVEKFVQLLKPGGLVFLDGSAARKKYELSTFMVRHIYPGNHSFMVLDDFMNKVMKTPLEPLEVHNDRHSYFLTFRQWARNLEKNKTFIKKEFGDFEYRKFRLYLWGATYEFLSRNLECYRTVLRLPENV